MNKLFNRKEYMKAMDQFALATKAASLLCKAAGTYCTVMNKMATNKVTREALAIATERVCIVIETEFANLMETTQKQHSEELMELVADVQAFKEADKDAARGSKAKPKAHYNEDETDDIKAPSEDEVKGMFSNIFKFKKPNTDH